MHVYGDVIDNTVDSGTCHAMTTANSATFLDGGTLMLSGGTCTQSGTAVCPSPITTYSPPAVTYPTPPAVSTTGMPSQTGAGCANSSPPTGHLSPGIYAANVHIQSNTQCVFAPGIYVFQNGLTISNGASVDASAGVLFYFPNNTAADVFNVSGGSTITIAAQCFTASADCSQPQYAGLAIWQVSSSTMTISNGGSFTVSGTVYAPNANVNFTGGSVTPSVTALVAKTATFSNGAGASFGPTPSALAIAAATLPQWTINQPNYPGPTLQGSGGFGTYTWSASGVAGLTINASTGKISGTPTSSAAGQQLTVTLNDSFGDTAATRVFPVTINAQPSITSTSPLPAGNKNVAYSHDAREDRRYRTAHLVGVSRHAPRGSESEREHRCHLGDADAGRDVELHDHAC